MRELILSIPIVTAIWLLIKWATRARKQAKKYKTKITHMEDYPYWDEREFYNK